VGGVLFGGVTVTGMFVGGFGWFVAGGKRQYDGSGETLNDNGWFHKK